MNPEHVLIKEKTQPLFIAPIVDHKELHTFDQSRALDRLVTSYLLSKQDEFWRNNEAITY